MYSYNTCYSLSGADSTRGYMDRNEVSRSVESKADSEVAVKNRGGLLKTLTRFDRCLKARSALIKNESMWTLNSGDTDELAQTARQIDRVQLAMTKLSREVASVSRQIRALIAGKAHCVAMPSPAKRGDLLSEGHRTSRQGSAFAAVNVENGAVVVRVRKDTSEVWPQTEYGRFETWTQAQSFATMLNQRYGLDIMEAQHIIVSASLAAATSREEKL